MNLFSKQNEPLASRLRPKNLEEILGQKELVNILLKLKRPVSMIFYGPPGTGKTSLAKILSEKWNLPYYQLTGVSAGVKEIKDLIQEAKKFGTILLFLDEIHRFNSAQQDSLLEAVEEGKFLLIGATTEVPSFRVNRALLSRCQIYKLNTLTEEDFYELYNRAKKLIPSLELSKECIQFIIESSSKDARRFLGILDIIDSISSEAHIWTIEEIRNLLSSQLIIYDKNKENHYNYISAFIKSIRGSDPDAALYYLACMLEGGEDPIFILRRLVILASEDIGNASIYGLILAESALSAFEKIGMPEGRIILAQVTTFLASCPKSNASYLALEKAIEFVKQNGKSKEIPFHLRNAPTFLHKQEGNAKNYKYPHDYPNGFVEEFYFPEELRKNPPQFYFPSERGSEKSLKERLKNFWEKLGWKKYER